MKGETKLLEANIKGYLHEHEVGKDSVNRKPSGTPIKENIDILG